MDLSLILAACFISLVGLPHGALDPVIAHRVGLIRSPISAVSFTLSYLCIVALVVGLWLLVPTLALIGFLLISALHFGRDWHTKVRWGGLPYGLFLLGLPAFFHADAVSQIFGFLLFGEDPETALFALHVMGVGGLGALLMDLNRLTALRMAEAALLAVIAWSVEPLWYFVLYFCGLHSPRHLIPEFLRLDAGHRVTAVTVVLATTIATLALAAVVGSYVEVRYDNLNMLLFQLVFIGLAALTVPHMCLLEWVGYRESD
jgi:Brp/Blh family beta-carotene 15,15'-monooxygenase